jgi:hypothetical protein
VRKKGEESSQFKGNKQKMRRKNLNDSVGVGEFKPELVGITYTDAEQDTTYSVNLALVGKNVDYMRSIF